ncbi:MAG: protein kinase domain-containing protein [Planctomycetaceae bacterium]
MTDYRFVSTGIVPTQPPPDPAIPILDTPSAGNEDALTGEGAARQSAAAARVRLEEGDVIKARYRVVRHIAGGGMGDVYEVFDNVSREPRAVKLMKSHLLNSSQARERFIKESKAQDLRHPHIVKTIDIDDWPERNVLFITMELVSGQTLRQWFQEAAQAKRHPAFSVSDSLEICRQVCAALVYAHRVTIHRDIKPENILLDRTEDGRWHVRIADFGISKLLEVGDFTATNQVFGTFQYMAPEQQRDAGAVDHRADIYSVGVVLYELLTSTLPQGRFDFASAVNAHVPKKLDAIIDQALAPDPNRRLANASWMLAEIETVLKSLTNTLEPVTVQPTDVQLRNVEFNRLVIEIEQRRAPQITLPGVPPIPDEILELEGREEALAQALVLLRAGTHPALWTHQAALANLDQTLANVKADLERNTSQEVSVAARAKVTAQLRKDADTELVSLMHLAPGVTTKALFRFVDGMRATIDAEQILEGARGEYQQAIAEQVAKLEDEHTEALNGLHRAHAADLWTLIDAFLRQQHSEMRFPAAAWGEFEHQMLMQRRYRKKSHELLRVALAMHAELKAPMASQFRLGAPSDAFSTAIMAKHLTERLIRGRKWVVTGNGGGDFTTISEAIQAAAPYDTILVRPGVYQECLVLDKPLALLGDGVREHITIKGNCRGTIICRMTIGRIANLTLRDAAMDWDYANKAYYCVEIEAGAAELCDCDLSDGKLASVGITGEGTQPQIRSNYIHDGRGIGVFVHKKGRATIEHNHFFQNNNGICLEECRDVVVRKNCIRNSSGPGVVVGFWGHGTIEDNQIIFNRFGGIEVKGNGHYAVVLRKNQITHNKYAAVRVHVAGKAIVEDNDLRGNERGAWDITCSSEKDVKRARNQE